MTQLLLINCGNGASPRNKIIQVGQFDPQYGGLQGIEAGIDTDASMQVLLLGAVGGQTANALRQVGLAGKAGPAVAKTTEIFRWEKRGTAYVTDGSQSLLPAPETTSCAQSLGHIFHNPELTSLGQIH